ncbi:MAG TPA: carcinine hydrolase/isopenicillin-N N-acyltransferase family protein, partial [Candidatus Eremiobacteraeota bacterium]|nr:carcinine hydrolase/isopenicillin-N N-acyltransferase family protein [Candidatus Eremiobacteraeota bacterium]
NESSKIRYNRIKYLLENHANPLKIEDFIDMSQDTHDGPDNSIWRTGSTPKKTRTLGTWIVAIPKNDFPELYIKFANPEEDERIYRFTLDEAFWESGKFKEK